ncbi:ROK family protein [Dubosiella newyorkensis]|jgi:predicted NBD/HSP70 family sugar kinase|uniref:Sugar kinase n=1 Tax=Dubosiella newyorkensis TaxID=1862672 RepID=A0A1U7NK36_9FIRM|nr:ROK family protein [Dubosiella newyorkensis]MCI9040974.1 ROK family protein [Dubosiella newyorkensis]OLU44372.1 hypothetical protein BO225_10840 [Dubosiella newyorkensis]
MKRNRFICIDIGGTAIKYGVLDSNGEIVLIRETPTYAIEGGPALAKRIYGLCEELLEEVSDIQGIAISSAGVVDTNRACIIHASDAIPNYAGTSFKDTLAPFGLPVEAENDVNCAGLGEYVSGSAKNARLALILTIGTGIGGCFIENGRLLHGNSYSACEVGYLPFEEETFQNLASTSALCRFVAERKGDQLDRWNGRRIFKESAKGDPICQEEIERLGKRLGKGIAMLCYILNPQIVVLGGGIMSQEEKLRPWIEEGFKQASIPLIANSTTIRFASHQNAAGMKGALVHFLQKHPEQA